MRRDRRLDGAGPLLSGWAPRRAPCPPPASGAPPPAHRSFVERVIGALRLDAATYDEIEHDPSALGQAAGVVVLRRRRRRDRRRRAQAAAAPSAPCWARSSAGSISTAFIWLVGVYFMKHTSDYQELLRTLGFASAPQLLLVLRGIPLLGGLIALVALLWGLAAWVVAVRQALDVDTGRAVLVCVLAVLVNVACIVGLVLLLGGMLGGFGRGPGTVGF